jgi:hypothetical protein
LVITFDYFSYGGQPFNGSAGDGITFLLFDGTTPSNLFTVGAFGGSLGYAQGTTIGTIAPGLTNAYIGVGFDEFGSFANDTEGRGANSSFPNNCATTAGFPVAASGRVPDSVTVRGSGGRRRNRQDGYCVLANSGSLVAQVNDPNGIDNPSVPAIGPRNQARRSVRITLTPNSVLTVEMSLSGTGNFQRVIGPLNLRQFPNQVPPTTFKFGFASSTGLATNIHEVQNLRITTLENVGGNVPRCNRGPNRCQP